MEFFELDGYTIRGAANGQEALNLLNKGQVPKLILLDLMMPVMNGWEFLDHVKHDENWKKIPVIVLSAHPEKFKYMNAEHFLSKPVDITSLEELVSKYAPLAN